MKNALEVPRAEDIKNRGWSNIQLAICLEVAYQLTCELRSDNFNMYDRGLFLNYQFGGRRLQESSYDFVFKDLRIYFEMSYKRPALAGGPMALVEYWDLKPSDAIVTEIYIYIYGPAGAFPSRRPSHRHLLRRVSLKPCLL